MAPRRKAVNRFRASTNDFSRSKENVYLRSLSDYQARVRRRDTIRNNKNSLECDLEEKIDFEMKMWEASSRLLTASRQPCQALEAARALLISKERMAAYIDELNRRKRGSIKAIAKSSSSDGVPTTGRLSISDLRLPLMWRDSDHFKNRGDDRKFAVFCLVRVGSEIQDTCLTCPVDREQTDISFSDILMFRNVPAEFELILEVYAHALQEDFSIAGARRRLRRSIHSSISKTIGKKWATSLREEQDRPKTRGAHFQLVASAKLNLDNTDSNICTHDLILKNSATKQQSLPLFGHFCCCLAVEPDCLLREACIGHIRLNGYQCWARLHNFRLRAWRSKAQADDECDSLYDIPVEKETKLEKMDTGLLHIINHCASPSNLTTNERFDILHPETNENAQLWFSRLSALIYEHSRWKNAAVHPQRVKAPCPTTTRNASFTLEQQSSLYDEIPIITTNGN